MPYQIQSETHSGSFHFIPSETSAELQKYPFLRLASLANKDASSLCFVCQQLDFDFLFNTPLSKVIVKEDTPLPIALTNGINLGNVTEIAKKSKSCKFCALVLSTLSSNLQL